MGQRRERLDKRIARQKAARINNSPIKELERQRRDAKMVEILKNNSAPYAPEVINWVGTKLGKKASRVTEADIKTAIA